MSNGCNIVGAGRAHLRLVQIGWGPDLVLEVTTEGDIAIYRVENGAEVAGSRAVHKTAAEAGLGPGSGAAEQYRALTRAIEEMDALFG